MPNFGSVPVKGWVGGGFGLGWVEIREPHRVRFSTLTVRILNKIVAGNFDMFPGANPLQY